MPILRLCWRNLWRNRRRTLLTMSAMGCATALVTITLAIYDGMFRDMIDQATLYMGQVRVTAPGYVENPRTDTIIPEDGVRAELLGKRGVRGVAGRVRGFALLSCGVGDSASAQPAEILGVDPTEEHGVSRYETCVVAGRFLDGADTKGIVLGKGLARSLDAVVGSEVVAMGQDAYGSVAAEVFIVCGIVDTGDQLRDVSSAVAGRRTVQRMLALEGSIHEWAVSIDNSADASGFAERLARDCAGLEVLPWNRFLPQLNDIFDLTRVIRFIYAVIFYFAVVLVTVNTMYMALHERMREFAVMNALGLRPRRLSVIVVVEGLIMSGFASLAGGLAGTAVSMWLSSHPVDLAGFTGSITYAETVIQPRIGAWVTPDIVIIPICVLVIAGFVVSLFPARRLARMRAVEVLREV